MAKSEERQMDMGKKSRTYETLRNSFQLRQLCKVLLVTMAVIYMFNAIEAAALPVQPEIQLPIPSENVLVQSAATEQLTTAEITEPETEPKDSEPEATEPVTNFMLIGHNQNLADTMILCSVDPNHKTLTMISFLRDLYLTIPSYADHPSDKNRMNTCYYWGRKRTGTPQGGMELLSLCVGENFGISVDHCISVDFDAFAGAIDRMGGVEIELTEQEARYLSRSVGYVGKMEPGMQTLSGREALAYSRIRKIDSDIQRTGRQRTVLTSLLKKCREMSPGQLLEVAAAVIPTVESDMSVWEMTGYLLQLLPQWQDYTIRSTHCPAENSVIPGSCWNRRVTIGGTECAVIECDLQKNKEYIMEFLAAE